MTEMKGCTEIKIPSDAFDNVPRASPEMVAVMEVMLGNRGVDHAPDLSGMPAVEEFSDPKAFYEMMRELEEFIARERQPLWRRVLRKMFGRGK